VLDEIAKVRVGTFAGEHWGRVAAFQFAHLGVGRSTVHNWTRAGYLYEVLPTVYGVGHAAASREAELYAAVLCAGPGAALSHLTAAWWRGLVEFPGPVIHVTTPRRRACPPGIRLHARRSPVPRVLLRRIPVTTLAETLLGLAACTPDLMLVRKALARIEYVDGMLDVGPLRAVCGRGRPGSGRLNHALDSYDPRLAHANGRLELGFYAFCEHRQRKGIPLPELNVSIDGVMVDAYFRAHALVVELDGDANHRTPAQRRRDRRNEVILRGHGIEVVRYDWALVEHEPRLVERDLLATLARRAELVRRRARG